LTTPLTKLEVEVNVDKTKVVDLTKEESFSFLGFDFKRVKSKTGKWYPQKTPISKKRTELLDKLKQEFRRLQTQALDVVIYKINPIIRGWVNYYRIGHSSRCFNYIRDWVEKKVRRHLMKVRKRKGYGWKRWSKEMLYEECGLFDDYQIRYFQAKPKAFPAR
jgi:RNA-directed DNA polymerase